MAVYQFEEVLRTLRSELNSKFIEIYYTRKSLSVYDKEIDYLERLLEAMKEQNEKGNSPARKVEDTGTFAFSATGEE